MGFLLATPSTLQFRAEGIIAQITDECHFAESKNSSLGASLYLSYLTFTSKKLFSLLIRAMHNRVRNSDKTSRNAQ